MNRAAIFLALLLPWAAGCRMAPTEVVSKECGVSIMMPGPPAYEGPTFAVKDGTWTNHQYRVAQGGITYRFTCTLAPGLMDGGGPDELLDQSTKGFLLNGERRLVTEHDLTLQGHRGRELVMQSSDYTLRNRVYLLQNATINISVLGAEAAEVALPAADRFLDSLRLIPEARSPKPGA